jgi:hypothetical protein
MSHAQRQLDPHPVRAGDTSCDLTFGETAGLRQVTIHNGLIRAEILVDKGANMRQFWHVPTGVRMLAEARNWHDRLAEFHSAGRRGNSYADYYEGGWQDLIPARALFDGRQVAEDRVGEAAIRPWELIRWVATPDGAHVLCRVDLPGRGLAVDKQFSVRRGEPAVRVDTTIRNASDREIRLAWTQHPALGGDLLDDEHAFVRLTGGRRRATRDADGNGVTSGATTWRRAEQHLPANGSPDRFTTFSDVERNQVELANTALSLGVRLRWDAAVFRHAWLWSANRAEIRCIAMEPSTTYLPEMLARPVREPYLMLPAGDSIESWVEISTFAPSFDGRSGDPQAGD